MEIEKQVCSLELAKRLKELGVKQESCFYWDSIDGGKLFLWKIGDLISFSYEETYASPSEYSYSAFSVVELGEMLPHHTPSMKDGQGFSCSTLISEDGEVTHWDTHIRDVDENFSPQTIWGATEADARAKMLIYLIENKIWTVK